MVSDDYDYMQPPTIAGKPATVYVRLVLIKIRDMDVTDMIYTADVMYSQFWTDHRLRVPDWFNKSMLVIDSKWKDELWFPRIMFKNAVTETIENGLSSTFFMKLMNNSVIHLKTRASLRLTCQMDLREFPHDTQICEIVAMSELYTIEELVVLWDKGTAFRGSVHLILPQFVIEKLKVIDCCNYTYDYGTFSCIEGEMHLHRLVGFYLINIYIPTILIVAMSMLTFWIPPDAVPARVTLGVTSLLTMITKQYGANMPNVSYVVALNVWLSSCIGFVFCGLLEYAVVIGYDSYLKYKNSSIVPRVTPVLAFGTTRAENTDKEDRSSDSLFQKITPQHIDTVSRILFPTCFLTYCVAYFIRYS